MKKTTALLAALLLASTGMASVQSHAAETDKNEQVITRVGTRPSGVGSHTTFTDMTHMALTGMKDGKNVTWMEEVSEQQYNAK